MEGARTATDPARGRTGVRRKLPALVAAALAAATDVAYLAIVRAERTAWISARVAFVAGFIALAACCPAVLVGGIALT